MGIERENKTKSQVEAESILRDIKNVGPNKPVGYLPIETITHYCKSNLEDLVSESKANGLETRIFTGDQWPGYQGSLYVYDRAALQALLYKDKSILIQAGWPVMADTFVENLHVQVPIGTPLFKLIARAFGDSFNENLDPI